MEDIIESSKTDDGGLYHRAPYLFWKPGDTEIVIDGRFTIEQLKKLIEFVESAPGS